MRVVPTLLLLFLWCLAAACCPFDVGDVVGELNEQIEHTERPVKETCAWLAPERGGDLRTGYPPGEHLAQILAERSADTRGAWRALLELGHGLAASGPDGPLCSTPPGSEALGACLETLAASGPQALEKRTCREVVETVWTCAAQASDAGRGTGLAAVELLAALRRDFESAAALLQDPEKLAVALNLSGAVVTAMVYFSTSLTEVARSVAEDIPVASGMARLVLESVLELVLSELAEAVLVELERTRLVSAMAVAREACGVYEHRESYPGPTLALLRTLVLRVAPDQDVRERLTSICAHPDVADYELCDEVIDEIGARSALAERRSIPAESSPPRQLLELVSSNGVDPEETHRTWPLEKATAGCRGECTLEGIRSRASILVFLFQTPETTAVPPRARGLSRAALDALADDHRQMLGEIGGLRRDLQRQIASYEELVESYQKSVLALQQRTVSIEADLTRLLDRCNEQKRAYRSERREVVVQSGALAPDGLPVPELDALCDGALPAAAAPSHFVASREGALLEVSIDAATICDVSRPFAVRVNFGEIGSCEVPVARPADWKALAEVLALLEPESIAFSGYTDYVRIQEGGCSVTERSCVAGSSNAVPVVARNNDELAELRGRVLKEDFECYLQQSESAAVLQQANLTSGGQPRRRDRLTGADPLAEEHAECARYGLAAGSVCNDLLRRVEVSVVSTRLPTTQCQ